MKFKLKQLNYDWEYVLNQYRHFVRQQDTVLEIGASNIHRTRQLAENCKNLIGVEYYKSRLPQNFSNIRYIQGDWQKLSSVLKKNSIDLAVASHVIEHVPQDLTAINQLYYVLKPGGVAIINTPNRKRLSRILIEIFSGPRQFPYWEHIREYDQNEIRDLIKSSKFKNFQITPIVFGIHSGNVKLYLKSVPRFFTPWANYWHITLQK